MQIIIENAHKEVSRLCHEMAGKEQRGYAQAAWFEQNGREQVRAALGKDEFAGWLKKALELGYAEEEVIINPYTSTHNVWYSWTSFGLEIPIYGRFNRTIEKFNFPANSELPKAFVAPFLEREQKEADKLALVVAEQEAAEKAERERKKAERVDWITTHGSDYLRRATALDYDCQRQYVTERAELELSGYQVDFDDRANWKSRACPSEEALTEVEALLEQGHEAKVVWLTSPAEKPDCDEDDEYCRDEFEPCEAIVIRGYLDRYDLVKVL